MPSINANPIHCPSCLNIMTEPLAECPTCGLSLSKLDRIFGTIPRLLRHVADLSGLLDDKGAEKMQKLIEAMERKFPGVHMTVVTMPLLARFNAREYVFWLFNRCNFSPIESRLERNFSILLFIDSNSSNVLMTTGYGLHGIVPEESLQDIIDTALPSFRQRNFSKGCLIIIRDLARRLKTGSKEQKKAAPQMKPVPREESETPIPS